MCNRGFNSFHIRAPHNEPRARLCINMPEKKNA